MTHELSYRPSSVVGANKRSGRDWLVRTDIEVESVEADYIRLVIKLMTADDQ